MPYYEYSKLTPEERAQLVRERLARGYPPHSPPHPVRDQPVYMLTAACYQHACHMHIEDRRRQLLDALFEAFVHDAMEVRAWVVLPNHYHILVHTRDFRALSANLRYVHGTLARRWNMEDAIPGRQVWYRFTDRALRSERHYCVTLNYIHHNPVKHRWTASPYDWAASSVHWYLRHHGREWLRDLWARYPVRSYGQGWDEMPSGRTCGAAR